MPSETRRPVPWIPTSVGPGHPRLPEQLSPCLNQKQGELYRAITGVYGGPNLLKAARLTVSGPVRRCCEDINARMLTITGFVAQDSRLYATARFIGAGIHTVGGVCLGAVQGVLLPARILKSSPDILKV